MHASAAPLRFRQDGGFRIMQVADPQDTQHTSPDTIRFLERALDQARPDLVVFTGDQVKGYGFSFYGGDRKKKVEAAIRHLIDPVAARNIPFAVTFGNHDAQAGCDKAEQMAVYQSYPQCVNAPVDSTLPGGATFHLPIVAHDGDAVRFNLYVIDSLEKDPDGGYASVSTEQIVWCQAVSRRLTEENGGQKVPSLLFQHIPVPEMYRLLEQVAPKTKGAVQGNGPRTAWYVLPEELRRTGGYLLENIAAPYHGNRQFEAWVEQGDLLGAYFGHDHNNCFVGTLEGIDLGYTPGCGFHVYGPGLQRAVRLFDLNEADPWHYQTEVLTYEQVCGKRVQEPARYWLYTHAPSSVSAAMPLIRKAAVTAGAAAGMAVLLAAIRKKQQGRKR